MSATGKPPEGGGPESVRQKTERLKAARLQAEVDKKARVERATRKAAARRKVLGDGKA